MSDDLHRFYVRWSGMDRKGVVKIGPFRYEFDRPPSVLKVFDIWYEPGLQAEVRERACDEQREMTTDQVKAVSAWVRNIGAIVRQLKDVIEAR